MLIFNKLEIQSFKSIFKTTINFDDLQNQFYSMEGINHTETFAQSNGSGKSTFWDALAYVLFGTTTGIYIKKEEYQNKNTKIPLRLILNFSITEGEYIGNYILKRSLNETYLYKNNEDISELNKTETEKKLQKIINLTKEEFFSFTYLTQTSSGNFFAKTASEKLAVIKDFIFGEELLQIKNKLSDMLSFYKSEKIRLSKELATVTGKLSGLKEIKILKPEEMPNEIDITYCEDEIQDNKQELAELFLARDNKRSYERQISGLTAKFDMYKNQLTKLKVDMEHIKQNICPTCKQILPVDGVVEQNIRQQAKQIKNRAMETKETVYNIKQKLEQMVNVDNRIAELTKNIADNENFIKQLQQQQGIEDKLDNLQKQQQCLEKAEQINTTNIEQLTKLQKYFNTTFIQYVQQSFLNEIENYLNLFCYEVFNKKFSLKLNNNNLELFIGNNPYSYFSGGERQRIDFLFVFAIKVALSNFTDKCTNLLIFDESLSAQDSVAFENCVDLINRLSSANNLTTILISHRETTDVSSNKIILERFDNKTDLKIIKI